MASTPTITSPADNSTQSLPFNLDGTGTINALVEVRDDAGYLLPATQNPVTVDGAGDWRIVVTSLTGTKTGCKWYAAAGGEVADAGSIPTVGVGLSAFSWRQLDRTTNLPTYNSMTACGHFYQVTSDANPQAVFCVDNATAQWVLYVIIPPSSTNFRAMTNWANNATSNFTISTGAWYYWALTVDGTTGTLYCAASGTDLSTGYTFTVGTTQTTSKLWVTTSDSAEYFRGYAARVRAWSSVLSLSELNAERTSATVVKSGYLFDAPFTSTSDLGGFTQSSCASGP